MSEKNLKVGQKVEIVGKNVTGEMFIGMNEPVGKSNGSLKGTVYFTCPENCGMFVRPTQLVVLVDAGNPVEMSTSGENQATRSRLSTSRLSWAGSRQSLLGSRSQIASTTSERPSVPASASMKTSIASERTDKKYSISPPDYWEINKTPLLIPLVDF